MGLALAAALLVRLIYPIGMVGGFPQDDAIYTTIAQNIVRGDHGWQHYVNLPDDHVADPANWFNFRVLFTYPLALMRGWFGPGDGPATLLPTLASLVTIAATAGIAAEVFGRRAAPYAAWLIGFFPIELAASTRILLDSPFAAWITLAYYLALRGAREDKRDRADLAWLGAGACLACAYLTKVVAVHVGAIYAAPLLLGCTPPGRRLRSAWLLVAPALCTILIEGCVYRMLTDRFWLHSFILRSALEKKLSTEGVGILSLLPNLRVVWEGYFDSYLPLLFGWARIQPMDWPAGCAMLFWPAVLGACLLWPGGDRRTRSTILVFAGLCLLLEILPASLRRNHYGGLDWFLLPRQDRFVPIAAPLAAVLAAGWLTRVLEPRFGGRLLAPLALLAVLIAYRPALLAQNRGFRASLEDMRQSALVADTLRAPVHSDYWTLQLFDHYLGSADPDRRNPILPDTTPESIRGGLVILGGSRGMELDFSAVSASLPDWARDLASGRAAAPAGWVLIFSLPGTWQDNRHHDLAIYAVPETPSDLSPPSE